MDMMDIGYGFFMVKFDLEVDREKVISGGPWMIFDHCVAIRPWTTDFISSQVQINKTLVWIRFPSLGMEYYDESLLLALATAVGRPVKVDIHTLDASRGKFARVCIEIDLDKPVVGKVWFRDYWYKVEYEGLHLLCQRCGLYGHVSRNCSGSINVKQATKVCTNMMVVGGETVVPTATEPNSHTNTESNKNDTRLNGEDLYGDWLVVNRKKNQGRKSRPKNQGGIAGNMEVKKQGSKGLMFAHLAEVGNRFEDGGDKFHVMGSKFHPGETSKVPKVWTKKKNKRARGMGHTGDESNKKGNAALSLGPKKQNGPTASGQGGQHNSHMFQNGPRVDPGPVLLGPVAKHGATMSFGAVRSQERNSIGGDNHLKPAAPNESPGEKQTDEFEDANGDDEMVAETPLSNQ
jgi:hypothetical protein